MGAFGDGLFAYLLPVYIRDTLQASPTEIGILYAILNLCTAMTLLIAGTLADKYDRKKIMIVGWIAWLPAPLIFSMAGNWIQMIPGMIMWGCWFGGPSTTAYIVTSADKSKLMMTFATISAAWSVGYVISPSLGGYLAETIGMTYVFYLSFLLYSVACLTMFFLSSQRAEKSFHSSQEEPSSMLQLLRTRKLVMLSIFFATLMFSVMMFRPFIPTFLDDAYRYAKFEIGILGSVSFASSAGLGILFGRIGDKSRRSNALTISLLFGTASLVFLLLSSNFAVLIFAFFLAGGSYMIWSLMNAIVGPLAPASCRARWAAIPQTLSMFASFIAPYLGGLLYEVSPQYVFVAAIPALLAIVFVSTTKLLK